MTIAEESKTLVHELYNKLAQRPEKNEELLDIMDVLYQVYLKIDETKYPERLINRLVNYIYSTGLKGNLYFPEDENKLIVSLGIIGRKAGLNGLYRAHYGDKSQFYSYFDSEKGR